MKEWLMEMADYFRSISTTDQYYIDRAKRYDDAARYYNPHPNHGSLGRPGSRSQSEWRNKHVKHV